MEGLSIGYLPVHHLGGLQSFSRLTSHPPQAFSDDQRPSSHRPRSSAPPEQKKCCHYLVLCPTPDTVESRVAQRVTNSNQQPGRQPYASDRRVIPRGRAQHQASSTHPLLDSVAVKHVRGPDTPRLRVGESFAATHRCCNARPASRRAGQSRNPPAVDLRRPPRPPQAPQAPS
jgi:hypothetical protein